MYLDIGEEPNWDAQLRGGNGDWSLGDLLPWSTEEYHAYKIPKGEGLEKFWNWVTDIRYSKKIVQWGRNDLSDVIRESVEYGVHYPHRLHSINLKDYYKFLFQPMTRRSRMCGLGSAMIAFDIDWEGPQHDALNDAIACGGVYSRMLNDVKSLYAIKDLLVE